MAYSLIKKKVDLKEIDVILIDHKIEIIPSNINSLTSIGKHGRNFSLNISPIIHIFDAPAVSTS